MADEQPTVPNTVVMLPNLEHFKEKQDAFNEAKFALKGADKAGIATPDAPGIVKPSDDFDITADGTLSLYEPMAITAFTASPNQAERGATIADVTLAWTLNKTPATLTLDDTAQDTASTGKKLTGVNLTASKTYTLKATDARQKTAQATAQVSFLDKRHWAAADDMTADQVTDAIINAWDGQLASGRATTFTVNATGTRHVYYAFPDSWGDPRFFVGGFEGGFNLLKTFDHRNASGATVSYQVWKSANGGLGQTTVEVK